MGVDATGQEVTYAFFNAVLPDWARLGLMLAHDGTWNGKRIVPREWGLASTSIAPEDGHLKLGLIWSGYGYQIWTGARWQSYVRSPGYPQRTNISASAGPTRETILVVEDDSRVRQLTINRLQLIGYQVLEASDGPSALEMLNRGDPVDLVLTDLILPSGLTGRDVAIRAPDQTGRQGPADIGICGGACPRR